VAISAASRELDAVTAWLVDQDHERVWEISPHFAVAFDGRKNLKWTYGLPVATAVSKCAGARRGESPEVRGAHQLAPVDRAGRC
jgi:hypothetical protein